MFWNTTTIILINYLSMVSHQNSKRKIKYLNNKIKVYQYNDGVVVNMRPTIQHCPFCLGLKKKKKKKYGLQ